MSESVHNVPAAELVEKLAEFSKWRVENLDGDEKGEAQVFLDRLFRALGWPGVFEAGAKLEFRIAKEGGGKSFADLLWKPRVLIEMKKAGEDLASHYHQAFNYWIRAVPDRPRYVVLCNFDEFWIYDFENQVSAGREDSARPISGPLGIHWIHASGSGQTSIRKRPGCSYSGSCKRRRQSVCLSQRSRRCRRARAAIRTSMRDGNVCRRYRPLTGTLFHQSLGRCFEWGSGVRPHRRTLS